MTDFYIGTATEYTPGDTVKETIFYNDPDLARMAAARRAEEANQLFGMVYKVSHRIGETLDTAERFPHKVIELTGWSI